MTAPSPRELNVDVIHEIINTLHEVRENYITGYREGYGESKRGTESGRTGKADPTGQIVVQKAALQGELRWVARRLRKIRDDLEFTAHRFDDFLGQWDDPTARAKRSDVELPPIVTKDQRERIQADRDKEMNVELASEAADKLEGRIREGYVNLWKKVEAG